VTDSGFHGDRSIDHRPSNLKGSQSVSRCHDRSIMAFNSVAMFFGRGGGASSSQY
jgi:hypothetical protein